MSQFNCPECGTKIDSNVLSCPICGYPLATKEQIVDDMNKKGFSEQSKNNVQSAEKIIFAEEKSKSKNLDKKKPKIKINKKIVFAVLGILILTSAVGVAFKYIPPIISEIATNRVTTETFEDDFIKAKYTSNWIIEESKWKYGIAKILHKSDIDSKDNPKQLLLSSNFSVGFLYEEEINLGSLNLKYFQQSAENDEKALYMVNWALSDDQKIGDDYTIERSDNIITVTGTCKKNPQINIKAKYKYNPDSVNLNIIFIRYNQSSDSEAIKELEKFFNAAQIK